MQTTDIAQRVGKTRDHVNQWQRRKPRRGPQFPKPRWVRASGKMWDWEEDIVPWLKATDRGHLIKS